ncbi:MAG: 50S ribosomal protein L9 [Lachnospiraceae bacterium]|nr:50S ribosomal protein L9 [Lachnospiraceae bacterium]MBP5184130.1 50S ribosomal protein L9 [Lachnospiraceae bacterium]
MEVILLQDVKNLGKKGEIVKVNDGYAKNFIIPKKLGVEASKKNRADLEARQAAEAAHRQEVLEEAQALAAKLNDLTVNCKIRTGEGGRTFGSVSSKEVAEELKKQHGFDIDKKKLVLADAIKNLGTYTVQVKLHPQVTAQIKVRVDGE